MKDVKFFAPTTIDEMLKLLSEYGKGAVILAGGTDLVPRINYYELKPDVLLYIGGLGLDYIREEDGGLVIGAATPTATLAASALVGQRAGALAEGAIRSGSVETRNAGTIGGNLANASPAADLATPLLVMDALVNITGAGGERTAAIGEFFKGPGETVLRPDEFIKEISIPSFKGRTAFLKLGRRRAMTLSVVNVAVRLDMEAKECTEARIAMGAMAPTPIRCLKAEKMIKGKKLDEALIGRCAAEAVAESNPVDDQRATAWYRRKAGATLTARALRKGAGIENE